MKNLCCLFLWALALCITPVFGQETKTPAAIKEPASEPSLKKFDLDFPGGTPAELVSAIQKARGIPVNIVIPIDGAELKLPPLTMKNVDIAQLFQALSNSGGRAQVEGRSLNGRFIIEGFNIGTNGRPIVDDSIWVFTLGSKNFYGNPTNSAFFFLLTPYLERGLSVDDITTAIQTAWQMQGNLNTPKLSFHKETKLLIAVGEPASLSIVRDVLKALDSPAKQAPLPAKENK